MSGPFDQAAEWEKIDAIVGPPPGTLERVLAGSARVRHRRTLVRVAIAATIIVAVLTIGVIR